MKEEGINKMENSRFKIQNSKFVLLLVSLLALCSNAFAATPNTPARFAGLHIPFIENKGRINSAQVRFYANTFGGTVFAENGGVITYSLTAGDGEDKRGYVFKERLLHTGALSQIEGRTPAATSVNYFIGDDRSKWQTDIPSHEYVTYGEIYQGINLRLRAYGRNVEKLFTVEQGGNPGEIALNIEGADRIRINREGELELETELGTVRFTRPVAYQEINGKREYKEVAYALKGDNGYGFTTGQYNRDYPLVIDPLLASTFIGGGNADQANAIAIDSAGNVYVTGYVATGYPTTAGAYDTTFNTGNDVFVSKLNSTLTSLLASTFIGGNGDDRAFGIVLDSTGTNVYVTGYTPNSATKYPTTAGAYDTTHNLGTNDVFVSKLNNTLTSLLASTFIGGDADDKANAIGIDTAGNIYVTGYTAVPTTVSYPTTAGAYDVSHDLLYDVFVSKLNGDLTSLLASTFIGSTATEDAKAIAIDSAGGFVYITGYCPTGYPTTGGAYDTTHNAGTNDVFISKLNSDLTTLSASTYIGGNGQDQAFGIVLDQRRLMYM